jgi:arylsulfatase
MDIARSIWLGLLASLAAVTVASTPAAAQKKPNVVMLMSDDVGWGDYGV